MAIVFLLYSDALAFKTLVNIFMYCYAYLGVCIRDIVTCKSVLEHCAIHYSNLTIVTYQILQGLGAIHTLPLQFDQCKLIPLSGSVLLKSKYLIKIEGLASTNPCIA